MADRMYNGDIYILNVELKEDLRGIKMNTSSDMGGAGREQITSTSWEQQC